MEQRLDQLLLLVNELLLSAFEFLSLSGETPLVLCLFLLEQFFEILNFILSFDEIYHQILGVSALFESSDEVPDHIELLQILIKFLLL